MIKKQIRNFRFVRGARDKAEGKYTGLGVMAAFFAAGILFGSLIGSFYMTEDIPGALREVIGSHQMNQSFLQVFWGASKNHLLVLLAATSVAGLVFVPVISAVRGYLLSCTAASIITAFGGKGFLIAFVLLGIPALITVPCLFVLSMDALSSSKRLLRLSRGIPGPGALVPIVRHALYCLLFLAAAALLEYAVLPQLVSLIMG